MADDNPKQSESSGHNIPTAVAIQEWLVEQIASELQISPDQVKVDQPILSYGIDSMQVVTIVARLEDWLEFRFSSNPLEDHPTVESLATFVESLHSDSQSTTE